MSPSENKVIIIIIIIIMCRENHMLVTHCKQKTYTQECV